MRGEQTQRLSRHLPPIAMARRFWRCLCMAFLLCAAVCCVAQDGGLTAKASKPVSASQAKNGTTKTADAATTENDRKKQLADESSQLLSMALALKAEVDKTTKDTLSMNVIRKADEIEKLARTVKEKVKQGAGPT